MFNPKLEVPSGASSSRGTSSFCDSGTGSFPYTLYNTLYLIPYTLYLIPYTLYLIPYILTSVYNSIFTSNHNRALNIYPLVRVHTDGREKSAYGYFMDTLWIF
jgi:hypothetical protein